MPRSWWPDLAIGLAAFAAVVLLPLLLGGYVHERGHAQYALLWRELIGEAGRMPLETPKPLTTLRAALGPGPYFGLAALLFSLAPACLGRLSLRLYGTRLVGMGAVLLLLLGNGHFLSGPVLDGFWPLCFLGLMSLTLYAFAEGRYGAALGATALAGLVRPDAWGYALLLIVWIRLADREAARPAHLTALLCVPAWLLFDLLLTGDPLYSFSTLGTYQAVMGVPPTTPATFWPRLVTQLGESFVLPLLGAGLLGLAAALLRAASQRGDEGRIRRRAHGLAAALVASGVLGYWALSGLGDGVLLHVRFFVVPLLLLSLYAIALPMEVLEGWWAREDRPDPGKGLRRGLAAAAGAAAIAVGWTTTDAWANTTDAHRVRRLQHEARADALSYLREEWVDTDRALITGRSLEVFAYRLGPEAAARMYFFRFLAEDLELLGSLREGVAVYIGYDIAGADNWFVNLRRGQVMRVG
ncbi:MAG TPA: hypothetical protein VLL48_05700, partial [Longimicrobiales bacterium]|nr:hypothetical protein [Longimicrobiales bacterium]